MIAEISEPMVAVILFTALAVVVLVGFLSRCEYCLAERLELGRLGGSLADAAGPPGLQKLLT